MTAQLLPVVVFVTVSLLSFTTGSNWGVIAITMPIVPLAQNFGVSIPLVMGALFSASGLDLTPAFIPIQPCSPRRAQGVKPMSMRSHSYPMHCWARSAAILFVAVA